MKTIEEQAAEYSELPQHPYKGNAERDFMAGAKAASRWIPVEEEPDYNDNKILCMNRFGRMMILTGRSLCISKVIYPGDYTHWLPMPPKPEK